MIIGGQAVLLYGGPRLTRDIDLTDRLSSMRSKQDALKLFQTGFMKQMAEAVSLHVAPIFWGHRVSDCTTSEAQINNGNIFFIECGGPPLAITADHVYEGYLERKESEPDLICQIWNLPFIPEERLIERNSQLDIATFQITESELDTMNKKIHHTPQWPPSPPEISKGVFLIGYPGHKKRRSENSIGWENFFLLLTADRIDDEKITCQIIREDWGNPFDGSEFQDLPPNQNLRSLSGTPLWTLVENPIISWRLAGIVQQLNEGYEILYAIRPNRIKLNGKLE